MASGSPHSVDARVLVTAFYEDVTRVTARKAQRAVPDVGAHRATAESDVAWSEVESVLRGTRPFTRGLVMAIFCSAEEIKSTTTKK